MILLCISIASTIIIVNIVITYIVITYIVIAFTNPNNIQVTPYIYIGQYVDDPYQSTCRL